MLRVALPSPPSARSARLQLARRACSTLVLSVRASVAPAAQWLRRAERFSTLRTSTRSSDGMITTESWFVARYRGATSLGPGDNRDHVMPISRGAPTRLSTHPCHSISLENQGSPASQLTCFAGLSLCYLLLPTIAIQPISVIGVFIGPLNFLNKPKVSESKMRISCLIIFFSNRCFCHPLLCLLFSFFFFAK